MEDTSILVHVLSKNHLVGDVQCPNQFQSRTYPIKLHSQCGTKRYHDRRTTSVHPMGFALWSQWTTST